LNSGTELWPGHDPGTAGWYAPPRQIPSITTTASHSTLLCNLELRGVRWRGTDQKAVNRVSVLRTTEMHEAADLSRWPSDEMTVMRISVA
jgi:hypothetical protein